MSNDIVDLTDEFNRIISEYEGGMTSGCVVDFDAWGVDDLVALSLVVDQALELCIQQRLLEIERETNDELLEEYDNELDSSGTQLRLFP